MALLNNPYIIDIIIGLFLIIYTFIGYLKGFIIRLYDFFSLFIAYFLTINFSFPLSKLIILYQLEGLLEPIGIKVNQLLVAVILSAQTTDKAVNKITPGLWARYPEIEDLASANLDDVEMCLRTIGLYKNKAKNIIKTARAVLMNFDGQVPKTHKELESLPGVGRKTANVVLAEVYGIPSIAVDTHVSRVSKRLNIAPEDASVEEIEEELMKKIPKRDWIISHHRMIFFGRYHCLAKNPKCQTCPLQSYCKYYKETTKK